MENNPDNRKNSNSSGGGLVRVSGSGKTGAKYDNFGYEIPERKLPVKKEETLPEKVPTQMRAKTSAQPERRLLIDDSPDENETVEKKKSSKTIIAKDKENAVQTRIHNKKVQRKNRILAFIRLGIFLLCIVGLVILVRFSGRKETEINTKYVLSGSVENSMEGELNFLMEEEQVVSSYSGIFVPSVNEGDRVSSGSVIGYVVESRYTEKLQQLKSVEEKITAALKAAEYLGDSKPSETAVIDSRIAGEIKNLSSMAMSGKLSDYSESIENLDKYFTERTEIIMNEDSQDAYISSLRTERADILKEIEYSLHKITAPASGIISFNTDGNEVAASTKTENLKNLIKNSDFASFSSVSVTDEQYESIQALTTELNATGNTSVSNGNVVARISGELSYYITMESFTAPDESVKVGQTINIRTRSGDVNFKASYVGTFKNGDTYILVAKSDKAVSNVISLRSASGRFIFSYTEGLKVPLTALTEWDEAGVTARLTVIRAGYVEYVYVNILADDGEYAIINSKATMDEDGIYVKVSDEYVVDFDKVQEGQQR